MKFLLVTCLIAMGLLSVGAAAEADRVEEKPEITKLELLDLGAGESDVDEDDSEVQRKRDSGYSYKRPSRLRFQLEQNGNRGRVVNRHPAQINRPITKYGPPGYQSSSPSRPHGQQHRDKLQSHNGGQQHSSNHDNRPNGYLEQEVPSPIRQVDFVEPNPISSQNNEPFASHAANYLPPQNQKLPGYTSPQTFSLTHAAQSFQNNGQSANFQSQSLVQSPEQISDAALFLAQNAHAIQQLYGAPANEQDFAPNNENRFAGQNDQVQQSVGQFQNLETSSPSPNGFSGPLPSYASGTLSAQETLEQIQSLEKDRLIVQLQRALATQTQDADAAGRYAQNQPSFVQNQDLLASLGQQMKIHAQPGTANVGPGNTAFNQSPFLPGTTISPGLPLNYGLLSTTTLPSTTTSTTTTTTVQPPQATKGDGTSQVGHLLPTPSLPPSTAGLPVYGGFVPTLIAGAGFLSNVPSYGPGFFAPGTVTSVQTSGSSPTHFGIPIPTDLGQKPTSTTTPTSTPSSTPVNPSTNRPSTPSSPPIHTVPLPVHPVTPLQPVLPATPAQTPSSAYPAYGIQTPVINPFLYKPVKPVYPFYYYPNVAYQLQKPAAPTYPWSYAPTYATQAKPAQIWK
ncbi:uncharacterized protein LOC143342095 [Colletes latitarsis]|uniref:uncharacterized protein LOC143342095 n=1 Tax=Colletes latitarsis TaxID=2605962 RepID=UPI00403612CA